MSDLHVESHEPAPHAPLQIRHILVCTDFSEHADVAMGQAIDLARQVGARVTLLHAFSPMPFLGPDGSGVALIGDVLSAAEEALEKRCEKIEAMGVKVEKRLLEGPAPEALLRATRELGCDLAVLGTHGRTGIKRAILGSVAERVVREAGCPVLTIRR
jgi:nucleotide-binding universal stress UspA family protein